MSNKKYTIYQRLTKMFGYNGQPIPTNNSYNFSKNDLLKTDSKDEYDKTLLQSQQSQYITDKWAKLDQSLYNQSVYYEANRLAAYYDFESMEFSIHGDTNIATPNGFITIKELADKGRDYEFTVYAYDHNQKKVVPAIARNAHFTRNEMTYKITFDDGTFIIATYGHRFLKRNGEFCVVEELKEGDSMMPFYRKDNSIYTFNVNQGENGWVDENTLLKDLKNINVNFNPIPWDLIVEKALKFKDLLICSKELKIDSEVLLKIISDGGFNNWETFINAYNNEDNNLFYDEKSLIVSIEPFGFVPVYDLTVPGYKNFATDTIFSHNTPEISAALDIFSEESSQISEKGEMLTIFSESDRIKTVLEDLFKNKLDINTNLPMWTRGMCKYGDDFVYLKIDPNDGIIGCQQLPNIEIERIEGGSYLTNKSDNMNQSRELRFAWKNRDMEFQNWEIAHFRLLGDDRKLPYGTSILDKIRRIWKQLLLAEDAMLIYRTTRAPERRVFKVFVGNMDDKDIESYVQRVANKFKRDQVVDQKTGQVDMRYNQMPVWSKTPIPLLDGRTITIEELAKEYEEGKQNWVYSIQDKTFAVVPGKVIWCGKNYTANKLIKVWLDDETWVLTAPEHPFILRDGKKVNAEDLKEGDSLMPYYVQKSKKGGMIRLDGYEMIYNPKNGKYEYVHRLVSDEKYKNIGYKYDKYKRVLHHVNFKKLNNNVENLVEMDRHEHWELHAKQLENTLNSPENLAIKRERIIIYNKSEKKRERNKYLAKKESWHLRMTSYNHSELHKEHNSIRREAQIKDWSNPEKKLERSVGMRVVLDDNVFEKINEKIISREIINRKTMMEFLSTDIIDYIISINNNKRLNKIKLINRCVLERHILNKGFKTITNYIDEIKKNHKVSRIETIYENEDVYCMTVVGINGEELFGNDIAI
jgi:hypothetical protein